MKSELLRDEAARLKALLDCGILDTPPEELFDEIAHLASYLCYTPIALIGFIDSTRQWFKSRVGWNPPEIPREDSFCEQTIHQRDLLIVENAAGDKRFCHVPLVTSDEVRFYAGVPLLTPEGYALGTICVMDSVQRELRHEQKSALLTLARLVTSLLEQRRPSPDVEIAQSHEALRESRERLNGIISSAMDAIITVDRDQKIVVFNRAAEEIFRCAASEALGQSIDRFLPERFREAHRQHIHSFEQTGVSTRSMDSGGTLVGMRTDGEEFPIEATISQARIGSEILHTVILRDVSARRRVEKELLQAQKAQAVGQLAGGIAHEFNNYLGIIIGYSELMAQAAVGNEPLGLAEIKTAAQKAAALTRQLLAFSRKRVFEPCALDLNDAICDAHKLLRRVIPANIDVTPVLTPHLGKVRADPAQIQQVLINLVLNSRDAMPKGGRITIGASEVSVNDEFASGELDVETSEYVSLWVSDTGEGIAADNLSHIFEPFYTTKKEGKGTGLGLSAVYDIVKHSGGHITVASTKGVGTTFRIYLPKLGAADGVATVPVTTQQAVAGRETILLVEDEASLRRCIRVTLEREGYRVLEAKDGKEAWSICEENAGDLALVVSDIVMPRMTGTQLREKVAEVWPHMPFIVMTGYAEDVASSLSQIAAEGNLLEKPFRPDDLVQKVHKLLATTSANTQGVEELRSSGHYNCLGA